MLSLCQSPLHNLKSTRSKEGHSALSSVIAHKGTMTPASCPYQTSLDATYLKNNGVSDQVLLGLPELANVMAHQPVKSSSCVSPLSQQPVGLSNPTIISSHLILVLQGCSKVYTHVKFYFQFIFDIISVPAGTDQ